MKKPKRDSPKCPFCLAHPTIKRGQRRNKNRTIQINQCKSCSRYFTTQPIEQTHKTYPIKTILNTISQYNLGTPIRKLPQPKSTIHNWLNSFPLPFNRLRNKIKTNPIEKKLFIHHRQPFLYQYHSLKLEFAKKFPSLTRYLKEINKNLPKQIFQNSERISQISRTTAKDEKETILTQKQNYAVILAKLAMAITTNNRERHNIIENFMLINDTATIATEIPVYLYANETEINKPLTGHIDILQSRYHKLYILDYKPEPVNKKQTINQLKLYGKALSKRTNIKEHKIKLAFFNDKGYYEII